MSDFDFMKELFNIARPSKEEMISRYIKGTITKQELDEFMKGLEK